MSSVAESLGSLAVESRTEESVAVLAVDGGEGGHGGHVTYRDVAKRLNFSGTLNASEELGAANRGFEMRGQGTLNAAPFTLLVTGGPLLNIDRTRPYPFNADIRAGQTYVTARGAVPKPFDLGQFHMAATARGPAQPDPPLP